MFEVRKWSDTSKTPYDVVFVSNNGDVFYQPDVEFSTIELAEKHHKSLTEHFTNPHFIYAHWNKE